MSARGATSSRRSTFVSSSVRASNKRSPIHLAASRLKVQPTSIQASPGRTSMTSEADDGAPRDVSRRNLFKQVGAAGAVAFTGAPLASKSAVAQEHAAPAPLPQLEALETLTAAEADILE